MKEPQDAYQTFLAVTHASLPPTTTSRRLTRAASLSQAAKDAAFQILARQGLRRHCESSRS
jgi:hypothetical protein